MKKGNERGAVLVVGLLIVLVLTILSVAAMMSTGTELMIAANDRSAKEAFYLGEAGVEEGRARLQTTSPYPISDSSHTTNVNWTAFIGTETKAQGKGYQSSNSNHARYDRLNPPNLNYVVTINHKVTPTPPSYPPPTGSYQVLYWGDSNNDGKPEENTTTGSNIYVVTSEGYTSSGATKTVRTEVARKPPITTPAALYTKAPTSLLGSSTSVLGMDSCGSSNKPGVDCKSTVSTSGNPTVTGSPSAMIQNSPTDIDVQYLINQFKPSANYSHNWINTTQSGVHWGTPTLGATVTSPSSCSEHNVVYINTNNTQVKLAGGSSGCGILLVEGDLNLDGGFSWYGVILVSGTITFKGGGDKNVTGAIVSGGTASADVDSVIGGHASVVYCSTAVYDQTNNLPLVMLRWVEQFY